MSVSDFIQITSLLLFIYLSFVTGKDYLKYGHSSRLNIFLLSASLTTAFLVQNITRLFNIEAEWFGLIGSVATLAHPYVLIRLVQHIQMVPKWIRWGALAGFFASVVIITFSVFASPAQAIILLIIVYFAGCELYAAFAFVRGALDTVGVTRRRLRMAAAGSGILGVILLLLGLTLIVPQLSSIVSSLAQLAVLGSSIAFYLAFATPKWLREYWQSRQLFQFLTAATHIVGSESSRDLHLMHLENAAANAVGGKITAVAVWNDEEKSKLVPLRGPDESDNDVFSWLNNTQSIDRSSAKTQVLHREQKLDAETLHLLDASNSNMVYVVSIKNAYVDVGYLLIFLQQESLFVDEDTEVLQLLGQQSTLVLENQRLIDELHVNNQQLQERTEILRESEERFRIIAEAIPVPLAITRIADGTILYANSQFSQIHQMSKGQIVGTTGLNFYESPADRQVLVDTLKNTGQVRGLELRLKRGGNGEPFWASVWSAYLDFQGERGLFSTFFDVTDKKKAADALYESEERYRATFEQAAVGVAQVSLEGKFLRVNRKLYEILDYPEGALLDTSLKDLTLDEDREADRHVYQAMMSGDMPTYSVEKRLMRSDGSIIWTNTSVSLVYDSASQPQYMGVIIQDISRRKQAEEAMYDLNTELRAVNKELEAFTYSVSHDLRAPLRAMSGFSKQLQSKYAQDLPERAQHYLVRIQQNAERMGNLIDDLLTLSRLGRKPLELRNIDPQTMVKDILRDLNVEDEYPHIFIEVDDLPAIQADTVLIQQAYLNLITNALKFSTKQEKPHIHIGFAQVDGEPAYFIKDNGVGFDMQFADKLFGVFERLHSSQDYEGTGIGLATVQRVIHRHGGRIWADAEVGKGASFYFTLGRDSDHVR